MRRAFERAIAVIVFCGLVYLCYWLGCVKPLELLEGHIKCL